MPGKDLLSTLGDRSNPNRPTHVSHGQPVGANTNIPSSAMRGLPGAKDNDMLAAAASAAATTTDPNIDPAIDPGTITDPAVVSDPATQVSTVEPTTGKTQLQGWTEESLLAEMKKAREEAKRSRLEKNDSIERLKAQYERQLEELKHATKPLEDMAKELDQLKAKEADKKRSIEERLADREARLADKDAELKSLQDRHSRELLNLRAELEKSQTEVNIQNQFYQEKLDEELSLVPDKFKDLAIRLTKGCDTTRDALEVLRDAKDRGLFRERQTTVSHATPDANSGARASSASTRADETERRKKMKSTDKIGEGLKSLNNNPIFKSGKRF